MTIPIRILTLALVATAVACAGMTLVLVAAHAS
jgi:hypothetical protein